MTNTPSRFLSGIQPSGQLHLGNYFGAIRQHVANQEAGNSFYFIANYHALTTIQKATELRDNTFEVAVTYLACGLDPDHSVLFRQSDVPEVTELTWLLMTVTGMGLLERAVSYKDKVAKGVKASCGLFAYPVLMAADILAYRSNVVPVGPDQVQHVEMTRDMAQTFNNRYGEVFVVPEYRLGTEIAVPGLDGAKMSKSYHNTIPIFADEKDLNKLVKSIKTSTAGVSERKVPEECVVFQLYSLFATSRDREDMALRYREGGYGFGEAKAELLKKISAHFAEARERRAALLARPDDVEDILQVGAARARVIAGEVTDAARQACGVA